jgi:hypothetical protein
MFHPETSHLWRSTFSVKMVRFLSLIPGNFTFTSAAGCRECMLSEPQDSPVGVGSSRIAVPRAKKRPRASSGGVGDNRRIKRGKQAQKILPSSRSTMVWICLYAHHIHQGADNAVIFKALKSEVQALKGICDGLERTIEDLKSGQDSHENLIEDHRIKILGLSAHLGTIDASYQGGN